MFGYLKGHQSYTAQKNIFISFFLIISLLILYIVLFRQHGYLSCYANNVSTIVSSDFIQVSVLATILQFWTEHFIQSTEYILLILLAMFKEYFMAVNTYLF